MDFASHKVSIGGHWEPTVMSSSRHPILNLLNIPGGKAKVEEWHSKDLEALRQRLIRDPYSFALVQEALEASSISGDSVDIEPKLAFQCAHIGQDGRTEGLQGDRTSKTRGGRRQQLRKLKHQREGVGDIT